MPVHLQPAAARETITATVELTGVREYTPEQMAELGKKLGLVDVQVDRITALPELGRLAKQLGVIETIKGTALFSQEALVGAMSEMKKILDSPEASIEEKDQAARTMGYLAEKMAKIGKNVVDVDRTVAEVEIAADVRYRNTFKAGMPVRAKVATETPKPK